MQGSCAAWELRCMGAVVYGSYGMRGLHGLGMQGLGVAGFGSCGV